MKSVAESVDFVRDFLVALGLKMSSSEGTPSEVPLSNPWPAPCRIFEGASANRDGRQAEGSAGSSGNDAQNGLRGGAAKFYPWGFAEKASPDIIAEGEKEWAKTGSLARYYDFVSCVDLTS